MPPLPRRRFLAQLAAPLCVGLLPGRAGAAQYDPLTPRDPGPVSTRDVTVSDANRRRQFPVLLYLPGGRGPAPVVLFSHGLGGSRTGSAYLGRHWAARGYVAVFVQHPGSDEAVWQDSSRLGGMMALRRAASAENLQLRVGDVKACLDFLTLANNAAGDGLYGRLDLGRVGLSGHSFGAVTTQALSGQRPGAPDPRIKAAVLFSPSPPRRGDARGAFAAVDRPWLLMTGTRDEARIVGLDVEDRLKVYPALPPGGKYELVLDGAAHSAFTDGARSGDQVPRNPAHHRVILALSTAFWDAWLRGEGPARAWLDGSGPRSLLAPADRWQRK